MLSEYNKCNDTGGFIPSLELSAKADPILTALAQLGAIRTGACRAFICLFDQARQYIIAEATPTSFLRPDTGKPGATCEPLWLQGSAIPRSNGICEQFLNRERPANNGSDTDLPVNVVADIHTDPNVSEESCNLLGTAIRGYVGVPIRSKNGIDFGEYSVVTERPLRDGQWTDADSRILREISKSILDHLLSKIPQLERIRAEKKISGIRSFVEQRPPIVDLRRHPLHDTDAVHNETDTRDGNMHNGHNVDRDFLQSQLHSDLCADGPGHIHHLGRVGGYPEGHETISNEFPHDHTPPTTPPHKYPGRIEKDPLTTVFSKAANIIRESFDADGVVFFDASVSSFNSSNKNFRGSDASQCPSPQEDESWSSNDSDADPRSARSDIHVIASSTLEGPVVVQDVYISDRKKMSFKALTALLRRYPRGGVFDFDENGNLEPGLYSRDSSQHASDAGSKSPQLVKRRTASFVGSLSNEISKSFPGARSVAFVPVYDQVKKRWRAGCFAYTMDKTRFFTAKADISYLRAFATLAMADIANQEAHLTSQAQSDVLGSLSHELRSPLHGIILGVEFLTDSPLSVFQGNLLHILETCGRTLSDTIDHLLYYAKVNNFIPPGKTAESRARGLRKEMNNTLQAGMKSITAPVRIDVLMEEVTESIFAGFNFQRMSIGQLERDQRKSHADIRAMRRSDNLQAAEDLGHLLGGDGGLAVSSGHVVIDLDIDPLHSHHYYGISGAIRRIVMNLFGNALKFTTFGSIRVSLSQEPMRRKKARANDLRWAKIVVTDTGKGISEDFLNNNLFLEFQQEDPITPGLGLGLSVVKKIVSSLRGKVFIESKVDVGTTATVMLPLQPVSYSFSLSGTPGFAPDDFAEHRSQLKGLRACLVGFGAPLGLPKPKGQANDRQSIWNVCEKDLAMEVISTTQAMALAPDIVLCEEAALYDSFVTRGELRKPPRVVVCVNALSAYRLSLDPRFQDPSTITEFISQPLVHPP